MAPASSRRGWPDYLFARLAGIEVQLIPYKGSAEVVQALLTGSVDFIIDGVAASLPLIQSGRLRSLAKLNSRPLSPLPDAAAARRRRRSAGARGHLDLDRPRGARRHAGAVVDKIQREVARIYADPVVAEKLENSGINAVSTPEELSAFFRQEAERWGEVFKESGIKLNSDTRSALSYPRRIPRVLTAARTAH